MQMSPRQQEVAFQAGVAMRAKDKEDAARLKQERTNMEDLLEAAEEHGSKALFAAVHKNLSPYFSKAAPFGGALAFFVAGTGKSALRVFPDGGAHAGGVRFEVDLAELVAAISCSSSSISPVEREAVVKTLPPLSPGSSPRWRSGTFTSAGETGELAGLFGERELGLYQAQIKQAGDEDAASYDAGPLDPRFERGI